MLAALKAWLESKGVPERKAAEAAPILFDWGFNNLDALNGISPEALQRSGFSIPKFTISNMEGTIILPAELMMDSGAETKLRLPGCKVVQLRLVQSGYVTMRGSTNHCVCALNFSLVRVITAFICDSVKEVTSTFLDVHANQQDYIHAVQHQAQKQNDTPPPRTSMVAVNPNLLDDSSTLIQVIHLSPVKHRPMDKPNNQVVIGVRGLAKLQMHINSEKQQLEIVEEEVLDPEM